MKRFTILLVALAAMAGLANLALAGDYHVGRLLVCSDCHVAHGSQSHSYSSDDHTSLVGTKGGDPPNEKLLRGATIANTCLNCHNGQPGIPDVLQNPTDDLSAGGGRSAGALNVDGTKNGYAQEAPYSKGDGHTLWSEDPIPGNTDTGAGPPLVSAEGLQCTDCHGAHGNGYFRNMNGVTSTVTYMNSKWTGKAVTYEIGATPSGNPSTKWVLEKAAHHYDNDNVQYMEPDQTRSAYGEWCQTCHTQFHGGNSGDFASNVVDPSSTPTTAVYKRHPTAGVNLTVGTSGEFALWANTNASHRLKLMSTSGSWTSTTDVADLTPSCFTCHKSHGNANKFGLIFVMGTSTNSNFAGGDASLKDPARGPMTEEGDGAQSRDLCRNCHGMGRWPAASSGQPANILP
jgi:hypothetical protein